MEVAQEPKLEALKRRAERERQARREAEALLESKALELFQANQELQRMVRDLEVERGRVMKLASTDDLTGLLNRGAFTEALAERLAEADQSGARVALFLVDIDHFKAVNDALGHAGGDALLREVAQRLCSVAGPDDVVARLGGDEFALAVRAAEVDPPTFAYELANVLRLPHRLLGRQVDSSASIGFSVYPVDADEPADLQRYADMALYRAKSQGRNRSSGFDQALRQDLARREVLAGELRTAIEEGQIVPWFQPIFDADGARVVGLEVLARWEHPTRGLVGPGVFVPLAEELGIVSVLDEQLFDAACRIAEPWVAEQLIDYIATNVSPRALMSSDFSTKLISRLRATNLPAQSLVVEITETFLMQDLAAARRHIERLASVGIKVALDDFGTGYSNLWALLKLPIDKIKIDQSLIADVGRDPRVSRLLRALLQTARALGVMVVAEGVEEEAQAIFLRAAGCSRLQGFLFARPAPAEETEALLRRSVRAAPAVPRAGGRRAG